MVVQGDESELYWSDEDGDDDHDDDHQGALPSNFITLPKNPIKVGQHNIWPDAGRPSYHHGYQTEITQSTKNFTF